MLDDFKKEFGLTEYKVCELGGNLVLPEYRGLGITTKLQTMEMELAKELGVELDDDGYIITDKKQATNVDGVYSAGDITGGAKQWVVACGEGAVAAISAYDYLNL